MVGEAGGEERRRRQQRNGGRVAAKMSQAASRPSGMQSTEKMWLRDVVDA